MKQADFDTTGPITPNVIEQLNRLFSDPEHVAGIRGDQLLKVKEAAARLRTSADWLYRHWKELPFAVQLSNRQLRFSTKGIEQYIEEKRNARTRVQEG